MMRIDAWTHFIPKPFADKMEQIAGNFADIGKRMREIPCIHDLDERRRVVDTFPDYAQILMHGMPPIENVVQGAQTEELCKLINDGFVDICAKHKDQFPGWVGQVSLGYPEGAVREAQRAIKNGALGVQIYTNINGKALDRPEYAEFFATMRKLDKPVWIHPTRDANFPDYLDEKKSLYEIWWTFGWSYETAAAMARLVFSKTLDNNPGLKLVMHHQLEARIVVERLGKDEARHRGRGLVRPAERPPDFVERLLLVEIVGKVRVARRMDPDRLVELAHSGEELGVFRPVERLAVDVGVDLHAERAVLDRALRLAHRAFRVAERHLADPARELVLVLGANVDEAVIDQLAQLLGLRALHDVLDRRHAVHEDLRIVRKRIDHAAALVEVMDAGDLAHALADVGEVAGDLLHLVGERFRDEVRPCVDAHHGRFPPTWCAESRAGRRAVASRRGVACSSERKGHGGAALVKPAASPENAWPVRDRSGCRSSQKIRPPRRSSRLLRRLPHAPPPRRDHPARE